jgi:methionine--tRNA ligase beta chain
MSITVDDFRKVELRVGRITSVDDIPTARKPMYKLSVEVGDGSTKQCVAGIKDAYSKDELKGRLVVVVTNLQPKMVAGVASECMLLAAFNDTTLALLTPDKDLPPGTQVS